MVGRERLLMEVLGLLYMTNRRLIFLPYLYTLSWSPLIVDLGFFTSLWGTDERNDWVTAVSSAANVPFGQSRAF